MKWWVTRRPFTFGGESWTVRTVWDGGAVRTELLRGGETVARDESRWGLPDGQRNHRLVHTLADGRTLDITSGYVGWWATGVAVQCDGALVHESHPGKTISWPGRPQGPQAEAELQRISDEQRVRWARNKYSIGVDVALGLLFFVVAKLTDLTTAALVGAAAGLAVVVVQRFVKVDLLGGLAVFGIVMLLISAGFSWLFQDDWAVKMKSTILGVLVATLMLSDALLNRGRYFGERLGRYLMEPTHPQRLALGIGVVGMIMAALNWGVARWASTDVWLFYTTFADIGISIALFFQVLRYARVVPGVAAQA
jgi:intracellular septation protein A